MPTALITGINGQDGSHLADFLLARGYRVCGMVRRSPADHYPRLAHIRERIELYQGDLIDQASVVRILERVRPDDVYNLAALTFVPASWQQPVLSAELTAVGVTRVLDGLRQVCPEARFYQASTSEMFGKVRETCSGILFNHEGPRRGPDFVSRKVTQAAARIKLGLAAGLRLGNLQARRDWGYAGDYVRAMWLMLQQPRPDDYVIGTGETHSVAELAEVAFARVGLDWREHVVVDPELYRPAEVDVLQADASKARRQLGWEPEVSFEELVRLMVDADLTLLRAEKARKGTPGAGRPAKQDTRLLNWLAPRSA
jgi:GDPmannose 4,6-dehydratase